MKCFITKYGRKPFSLLFLKVKWLIYLHLSVLIVKQLILKKNKKFGKGIILKAIERKEKDKNSYLDIDIGLSSK